MEMENFKKTKKCQPDIAWSLRSLNKDLKNEGFVYLTQQNEIKLKKLINQLGDVILTTDVKACKKSKSLVNSFNQLGLHTDHHKAKYIIWYCHENSVFGGESILLDALKIYRQLPKGYQEELKEIQLMEHKVFSEDKENHPMIQEFSNGDVSIYYSFWLTNLEDQNKIGFLNFRKKVEESKPISLKLQKDEILIIDNHRMLHGRKVIGVNQKRFLKRFWIVNN